MKFGTLTGDGGLVKSHPARGAWIEMMRRIRSWKSEWSHPARGAWIEIDYGSDVDNCPKVAPRKGCVD